MHYKNLELSYKTLFRILMGCIIGLALASGLFAEELRQERKRYDRIEDKYVRVRDQLGRPETQRLLDQSYLK